MEKEATLPNDAPDGWGRTLMLPYGQRLRSLAFYRDVLGATVIRDLAGTLCFLSFAGSQILLSVPFGSRSDQPVMSDPTPLDRTSVISDTPYSDS